jgi:hypothetical protein
MSRGLLVTFTREARGGCNPSDPTLNRLLALFRPWRFSNCRWYVRKPGDYTAELAILGNDPGTPATTVPVALVVEPSRRFVYLPAVMKGSE